MRGRPPTLCTHSCSLTTYLVVYSCMHGDEHFHANPVRITMRGTVALVILTALFTIFSASRIFVRPAKQGPSPYHASSFDQPRRIREDGSNRAASWDLKETVKATGMADGDALRKFTSASTRRGPDTTDHTQNASAFLSPIFAVPTTRPGGTRTGSNPPFVVLGIATSPYNTGHRTWIRATYLTLPNVQHSVHAVFLLGVLTSQGTAHPTHVRAAFRAEQAAHKDILFLNARETKPPGEKMIAFFRWCTTAYGTIDGGVAGSTLSGGEGAGAPRDRTAFCVKTDDDAYVHTVRLEVNLRALWMKEALTQAGRVQTVDDGADDRGPMIYMGATLWASYIQNSFEVCGHGMGPVSAAGASRSESCAARGGVGPFPYVAGTLEVLSMPLASWIVRQPEVARFVQRAHAQTPPKWNIGEDTVLGMWVYSSPFEITALHWGWDKIHDLCFKCLDKKQLWKPVTDQSVVIHIKGHQASELNFHNIHTNLSQRCDDACMQEVLPQDIPSLPHLCGISAGIHKSYSKCKGYA